MFIQRGVGKYAQKWDPNESMKLCERFPEWWWLRRGEDEDLDSPGQKEALLLNCTSKAAKLEI